MQFEFPEDRNFFAALLADGDVDRLESAYSDLFDFRHWSLKRWEFDKVRRKILKTLIEKHKGECQLRIHPECSAESVLEPDHIIPLSSNILNKELRHIRRSSTEKVESQSFGSNNPRNLTLACRRCNAFKKHHILAGGLIRKLIT